MPALSTAWNADGRYTARGLLATLARMGLREIELSYQCGPVEVRDYASACRAMGFRVVSVHNFCPVPENAPAGRARSEALLLSSLDEGERRRAVEATRRSIETAAGLGAGTLILHLGRVEVSCRTRELIGLYRAGLRGTPRWESILGRMRAQRAAKRGPHFSAALRSLDELCGAASDAALALAVENRFYHREIPSYGELREILRRFAGGPVGYWHDIGHAQVMENLGFCRHEEYLDAAGAVLRDSTCTTCSCAGTISRPRAGWSTSRGSQDAQGRGSSSCRRSTGRRRLSGACVFWSGRSESCRRRRGVRRMARRHRVYRQIEGKKRYEHRAKTIVSAAILVIILAFPISVYKARNPAAINLPAAMDVAQVARNLARGWVHHQYPASRPVRVAAAVNQASGHRESAAPRLAAGAAPGMKRGTILSTPDSTVTNFSSFFYLLTALLLFLLERRLSGGQTLAIASLIYLFSVPMLHSAVSGTGETLSAAMVTLLMLMISVDSNKSFLYSFVVGAVLGACYLTSYVFLVLLLPLIIHKNAVGRRGVSGTSRRCWWGFPPCRCPGWCAICISAPMPSSPSLFPRFSSAASGRRRAPPPGGEFICTWRTIMVSLLIITVRRVCLGFS